LKQINSKVGKWLNFTRTTKRATNARK